MATGEKVGGSISNKNRFATINAAEFNIFMNEKDFKKHRKSTESAVRTLRLSDLEKY